MVLGRVLRRRLWRFSVETKVLTRVLARGRQRKRSQQWKNIVFVFEIAGERFWQSAGATFWTAEQGVNIFVDFLDHFWGFIFGIANFSGQFRSENLKCWIPLQKRFWGKHTKKYIVHFPNNRRMSTTRWYSDRHRTINLFHSILWRTCHHSKDPAARQYGSKFKENTWTTTRLRRPLQCAVEKRLKHYMTFCDNCGELHITLQTCLSIIQEECKETLHAFPF